MYAISDTGHTTEEYHTIFLPFSGQNIVTLEVQDFLAPDKTFDTDLACFLKKAKEIKKINRRYNIYLWAEGYF